MYATADYPVTRPVRSVEPTALQEPIDLDQAKRQCRIADGITNDDEALQRIITSARRQVEADCAIVCYTGTFTWKQNDFPCRNFLPLPDVRPVTSITSITYIDSTGSTATMTASYYALQNGTATPHIALTYSNIWPTHRGDVGGVIVTYVAGFATVTALPEEIRQAVLLQVHIQYLDSLGEDTAKMQAAYKNHCARIRRSFY